MEKKVTQNANSNQQSTNKTNYETLNEVDNKEKEEIKTHTIKSSIGIEIKT